MAATPTVTIFNANILDVVVQVNNGVQFSVSAANATTWAPSSPSSGAPTWNNVAVAPNVFAPGDNYLTITPAGVPQGFNTVVSLPKTMWISLQLYIFFDTYSSVSWIALNNGEYVTGNLSLSATEKSLLHGTEKKHHA